MLTYDHLILLCIDFAHGIAVSTIGGRLLVAADNYVALDGVIRASRSRSDDHVRRLELVSADEEVLIQQGLLRISVLFVALFFTQQAGGVHL